MILSYNQWIKLNESINFNTQFEEIYENWKDSLSKNLKIWINSNINEQEEIEYTSGERAALTKGDQIITQPQLAAIYLWAKGQFEDGPDTDYVAKVPGISEYGTLEEDGSVTITKAAFADAIGINSPRTVTRTISKFVLLFNGEFEGTDSEIMSRKYETAFLEFERMPLTQIIKLAETTVSLPGVTRAQEKELEFREKNAARRQELKLSENMLGRKVYDLVKNLRSALYSGPGGMSLALNRALSKISQESGESEEYLRSIYRKYVKDPKNSVPSMFAV